MTTYDLIGRDRMEQSIVRRALHLWSKADEQVILPLVRSILQKYRLSHVRVREPRWETNVYPLYYWAHAQNRSTSVYGHVMELLIERFSTTATPEGSLRGQLLNLINSEIDILIEDTDYFLFAEAKVPNVSGKVRFEKSNGVHQLVCQYVQGKILEKLLGKRFLLAALGANKGEWIVLKLSKTEQALLRLVDEERISLEVPDIAWSTLTAAEGLAYSGYLSNVV
jgi:hypothetical protein